MDHAWVIGFGVLGFLDLSGGSSSIDWQRAASFINPITPLANGVVKLLEWRNRNCIIFRFSLSMKYFFSVWIYLSYCLVIFYNYEYVWDSLHLVALISSAWATGPWWSASSCEESKSESIMDYGETDRRRNEKSIFKKKVEPIFSSPEKMLACICGLIRARFCFLPLEAARLEQIEILWPSNNRSSFCDRSIAIRDFATRRIIKPRSLRSYNWPHSSKTKTFLHSTLSWQSPKRIFSSCERRLFASSQYSQSNKEHQHLKMGLLLLANFSSLCAQFHFLLKQDKADCPSNSCCCCCLLFRPARKAWLGIWPWVLASFAVSSSFHNLLLLPLPMFVAFNKEENQFLRLLQSLP